MTSPNASCLDSREQLVNTRSITTIGQQTHHVQVHEDGALQVGTMTIGRADVALPDSRGRVHVVDCIMCCLRLLQNCRFEQVWNKTVRPSPKVGLQGDWKPNDELHAMLVHCDTWTPRFAGLRGNIVPLGPIGSGVDNRAARHFQEGVVHYSELLILEKPPEMCEDMRYALETGYPDRVPSAGCWSPAENCFAYESWPCLDAGRRGSVKRMMRAMHRRLQRRTTV